MANPVDISSGVTWYWPGQPIPTPLPPGGVTASWNNQPAADLFSTAVNHFPSYEYDLDNHADGSGPWTVFSIVGEGKFVDFYLWGVPGQTEIHTGINAQLYVKPDGYPAGRTNRQDGPYWNLVPTGPGGGSKGAPPEFSQTDTEHYYLPNLGMRVLLEPEREYVLVVLGSGFDGTGQDFSMDVTYAPENIPDRRDNAWIVDIPGDGGIYNSPYLMNDGLTSATGGTDDPSDATDAYTAWWELVPEHAGTITASFSIIPQNIQGFALQMWRQDLTGTGTMVKVARATHNPSSLTADVQANVIYYFSVGQADTDTAPRLQIVGNQKYGITVTGGKTVLHNAPGDDGTGPKRWDDETLPPPDKYDPNATMPAVPDSGSATLLDLVRAFSIKARRAVRITGPTTISMVDPSTPLPTGWTAGDADGLYSTSRRSADVSTGSVTAAGAVITLSASADLVADDVRLVTSSWRLPDRLPVVDLPPAPVKRVTYTFSPDGFRASVEFHYPVAPAAATRP